MFVSYNSFLEDEVTLTKSDSYKNYVILGKANGELGEIEMVTSLSGFFWNYSPYIEPSWTYACPEGIQPLTV